MLGKSFEVKHFFSLIVPRKKVSFVLVRFERGENSERSCESGKKAEKLTQTRRNQLVWQATDHVSILTCKLARKFKVSKSYVPNIVVEAEVKHFKCQKAPHTNPDLEKRQKSCLRRLQEDCADHRQTL